MGRASVTVDGSEISVSTARGGLSKWLHEHHRLTHPPIISLCSSLSWFGLLGAAVFQSDICVTGADPARQLVGLQLFVDGWQQLHVTQSVSAVINFEVQSPNEQNKDTGRNVTLNCNRNYI